MTNFQRILDTVVAGKFPEHMLMPYMKFLSLPLISRWGDRFVEIDWEATGEVHQYANMVFGGYLSALADHAAAMVMMTFIGDKDLFFTNGLSIEYKRPIRTGIVHIRPEVIEETGSKVTVEVSLRNARGDLFTVARVNQTLFRQNQATS